MIVIYIDAMHERGEKLALKFEVAALFGFEAVEPARNIFRFNGPFHEKPLLRDFFIYCRPFGLGGNKKLFCCFRYDALRNCVPDIGKTLVDLGELPLKLAQSGEVYIFIGGNAFHLAGDIRDIIIREHGERFFKYKIFYFVFWDVFLFAVMETLLFTACVVIIPHAAFQSGFAAHGLPAMPAKYLCA